MAGARDKGEDKGKEASPNSSLEKNLTSFFSGPESTLFSFLTLQDFKALSMVSKSLSEAVKRNDTKYLRALTKELEKFLDLPKDTPGTFIEILNLNYREFLNRLKSGMSSADFKKAKQAAMLFLDISKNSDVIETIPGYLNIGCYLSIFHGKFESIAVKMLEVTSADSLPKDRLFELEPIEFPSVTPNAFLPRAVYSNWPNVSRILLDKFIANPDLKDEYNQTALALAVIQDRPLIVIDLLRHHSRVDLSAEATFNIGEFAYQMEGNALAMAIYRLYLLHGECRVFANKMQTQFSIPIIQLLYNVYKNINIPLESVNGQHISWSSVISDLKIKKIIGKKLKYDTIVNAPHAVDFKEKGEYAPAFNKLKLLFENYIAKKRDKSKVPWQTQKDKDQMVALTITNEWLNNLSSYKTPVEALFDLTQRLKVAIPDDRVGKLKRLTRRINYAEWHIVGFDVMESHKKQVSKVVEVKSKFEKKPR